MTEILKVKRDPWHNQTGYGKGERMGYLDCDRNEEDK